VTGTALQSDVVFRSIEGGITAPRGFRAAGVACGIKASSAGPSGGLDLSLLVSDTMASAAAVFTTNLAKAAPVLLSHDHLAQSGGLGRAVVINSGCANACTGADGRDHAVTMAARTAEAVGCDPSAVLVASTGVIGVKLKIAKGSGMIEPLMATMLGVVTTDAAVAPALLNRALKAAVDETFNAITVDGECSTNDCVFVLANGASGVELTELDFPLLVASLRAACEPLAVGIVRGGEGATKLITVRVTGARSDQEARRTARAIANSLLVKTAVHGGDPNWGRLIAVAGRAGSAFTLEKAVVRIGPITLFADGTPYDDRAPQAAEYLQGREIDLEVDLGTGGHGQSRMWTCDLSADYVRINADYRT
jgi:glutamate N-acetyltransferase/amino-acid N-acetyltransferase